MFIHCCHCDDCQRLTGSAFVLNAIIETQAIKLLRGKPVAVPVPCENGPHDIYRCPRCQTALWSDYGRRPNLRFVRAGTLDKPGALKPDVHIYTGGKRSGSSCRSECRRSGITTTPASSGPRPASNASTPRSAVTDAKRPPGFPRRRADRLRPVNYQPSDAVASDVSAENLGRGAVVCVRSISNRAERIL